MTSLFELVGQIGSGDFGSYFGDFGSCDSSLYVGDFGSGDFGSYVGDFGSYVVQVDSIGDLGESS